MKLWIAIICLSFTALASGHGHQASKEIPCKEENFCENGACRVEDGHKVCTCYTLDVTSDNTTVKASFSGLQCQNNFYQCFYNYAERECMMDIHEKYLQFESGIRQKKYRTNCGKLNAILSCLDAGLQTCEDFDKTDNSVETYRKMIEEWVESQDTYCTPRKFSRGDDCCSRKCNKFDKERLCQCNNACRRFGDCCWTKKLVCKNRDAKKRNFISSFKTPKGKIPKDCDNNMDGKICNKVQVESNKTMVEVMNMFEELKRLTERIEKKVEEKKNEVSKSQYVFQKEEDEHKENVHQEMVAKLKASYVRKPLHQLDFEMENCGNCSRIHCRDPCPPCQCRAYPNAFCRKDTCILTPCQTTGDCGARWYVHKSDDLITDEEREHTKDDNSNYFEVTAKCEEKMDLFNCHD